MFGTLKGRYTFKRAIERTGENADEVLKDLVETMRLDVDELMS